jgi:DnaJ-class molecular chaperone
VGIFDRLGDVIKSYLNDEDGRLFGAPRERERRSGDPDLDAAWDEVNDYLKGGQRAKVNEDGDMGGGESRGGWTDSRQAGRAAARVPEELRPDFAELGLAFGASEEDCKAAYKRLLKLHHPDRHAGHEGNMRKATEKSSRINAAYDRIEKWRARG